MALLLVADKVTALIQVVVVLVVATLLLAQVVQSVMILALAVQEIVARGVETQAQVVALRAAALVTSQMAKMSGSLILILMSLQLL
jgi:hypothetical protein